MDLTVVVPAYNEEENVEKAVNDIESVFVELGVSGEIVLVDDGSTDSTREVAETLAKTHPALRVVSHPRNFGRGRALEPDLRTRAVR
jgi:glycosyltransferase involved in cell wall biosynthesis